LQISVRGREREKKRERVRERERIGMEKELSVTNDKKEVTPHVSPSFSPLSFSYFDT
jgi:hypothetical protein